MKADAEAKKQLEEEAKKAQEDLQAAVKDTVAK